MKKILVIIAILAVVISYLLGIGFSHQFPPRIQEKFDKEINSKLVKTKKNPSERESESLKKENELLKKENEVIKRENELLERANESPKRKEELKKREQELKKRKEEEKYRLLNSYEVDLVDFNESDKKIGKTIKVQKNYEKWNLDYSKLIKDKNKIQETKNKKKFIFSFERFTYSKYDDEKQKEVLSSKNNNKLKEIIFTFNNGKRYVFYLNDLRTTVNGSAWVNEIETIDGIPVSKRMLIKKLISGYSLEFSKSFYKYLNTCKNVKIKIFYKNGKSGTQIMDLSEYQKYVKISVKK